MAVTGVVGFNGGGKTYYLAELGLAALKADRPVYTNFGLKGAENVLTWEDCLNVCLDMRGGLLLLDELAMLAPARGWAKFPPALFILCTQSRKFGLDIVWTSQSEDFVDKFFREVTSTYVLCKGLFGKRMEIHGVPGVSARLFYRRAVYAPTFRSRRPEMEWWHFRRNRPEVAESYNTNDLVVLARHLLAEQIGELKKSSRLEGVEHSEPVQIESSERAAGTPTLRQSRGHNL